MASKSVSRLWEDVEVEYGKLLDEVSRRDPQSLTGIAGLDEYFASCPDAVQQFYIELAQTRRRVQEVSSFRSSLSEDPESSNSSSGSSSSESPEAPDTPSF